MPAATAEHALLLAAAQVGRGEAVGAVWALTGGHHDTTALCARDSEFVRMSRGAFEVLAQQNPRATSNMLEGMARRISAASSARTKRCCSHLDPSAAQRLQSCTDSEKTMQLASARQMQVLQNRGLSW